MKKMIYAVSIIILLVLFKVVWVWSADRKLGSWEGERKDILGRCNYLSEKVITSPEKLLSEMPEALGRQFQGEWALYSCSMFAKALTNVSYIYPETKEANITKIDSLISIVLSPQIREYDTIRWGEDPLLSLDGEKSHISYLSHLAWMIGNYKTISDDNKYDALYHNLCETMNRRIINSTALNLPTYPYESIYVPDMLVAIVALNDYALANGGKYAQTVNQWILRAKTQWTDPRTGMLVSLLNHDGTQSPEASVKGYYSALNCYYLALIDPVYGKEQYQRLKQQFFRNGILSGIKEYTDRSPLIEEDIDAGIILFGLTPSGSAFAIGPATIYNDHATRNGLMRTAEIAGHTIPGPHRHYLLSNLALVGEAITLAMRTTQK